ncbi:hypothetical protein DL93DRAFT_1087344 [Clavulina sp. PMI_390]|nr:hypothetical protein DL93DRAFT_1087344 [Clavulina sp. PMI_390]
MWLPLQPRATKRGGVRSKRPAPARVSLSSSTSARIRQALASRQSPSPVNPPTAPWKRKAAETSDGESTEPQYDLIILSDADKENNNGETTDATDLAADLIGSQLTLPKLPLQPNVSERTRDVRLIFRESSRTDPTTRVVQRGHICEGCSIDRKPAWMTGNVTTQRTHIRSNVATRQESLQTFDASFRSFMAFLII